MKSSIFRTAIVALAIPVGAAAQGGASNAMRFQGMDTNHDGVITRNEWRGSERSFRNHDWNGDGRLSGDEVRPGAQRDSRWDDRDIDASIEQESNWTPAHFRELDHDGDGRIARNGGTPPGLFTRLDRNRRLSDAAEFTGTTTTIRRIDSRT
jgi:hypothetical protein